MAVLPIVEYPDSRLLKPTRAVEAFTPEIQQHIQDLLDTLAHEQALGLAANQVGIDQRILVTNVNMRLYEAVKPLVIINPVYIERSGSMVCDEGCLSFPGLMVSVKRYEKVVIEYFDEQFKKQIITADGDLLSNCLQHEIDHLDGRTMISDFSELKKSMALKKFKKLHSEVSSPSGEGIE